MVKFNTYIQKMEYSLKNQMKGVFKQIIVNSQLVKIQILLLLNFLEKVHLKVRLKLI